MYTYDDYCTRVLARSKIVGGGGGALYSGACYTVLYPGKYGTRNTQTCSCQEPRKSFLKSSGFDIGAQKSCRYSRIAVTQTAVISKVKCIQLDVDGTLLRA